MNLYKHPIKLMGLKSARDVGYLHLGTKVMKEELQPLEIESCSSKCLTYRMNLHIVNYNINSKAIIS